MKKIIFMAIASVILGASPLCGQALRVSYDFYRRHELGGGFHRAPDMMLDYDGDRAVFYCDAPLVMRKMVLLPQPLTPMMQ